MEFRRDIFGPAYRNTRNFQYYDLGRGVLVLDSDDEIDKYIVAYGPGHYQKICAAFDALDLEKICRFPVEVIDWACGVALGSWAFLKQIEQAGESLQVVQRITLIDPSWLCMLRGMEYLGRLARSNGERPCTLNAVNKFIHGLQASDFATQREAIKVHVFSNILDSDGVNLSQLHRLIIRNFFGVNFIVASSPYNMNRLEQFLDLFRATHRPEIGSSTTTSIRGWRYRTVRREMVEDDEIRRVEKVFMVVNRIA